MSAERDELAKLLFVTDNDAAPDPDHEWEMTTRHNPMHAEYAFAFADAILAAGYRKPRTITTAEELDALPNASLILDGKDQYREGLTSIEGRNWWRTMGPARVLASKEVDLPATVLYEPEARP